MRIVKWSLIALGTIAAGIGCYGAYEQSAINGGYLMVAAPVVALASAVIPFFAEEAWAARHRVKGVLLAMILIPAAATVFYAAAERVHLAKAGAEAERAALRSAVTLAERALDDAKASAVKAETDAKVWRSKSARACDPACVAKWDAAFSAARGRVGAASEGVTAAAAKASVESALKAPVWLLPLALDLVAFVAIWTGLSLPGRAPATAPAPAPAVPVIVPTLAPVAPAMPVPVAAAASAHVATVGAAQPKPKTRAKRQPAKKRQKKQRQALGSGLRLVSERS